MTNQYSIILAIIIAAFTISACGQEENSLMGPLPIESSGGGGDGGEGGSGGSY